MILAPQIDAIVKNRLYNFITLGGLSREYSVRDILLPIINQDPFVRMRLPRLGWMTPRHMSYNSIFGKE